MDVQDFRLSNCEVQTNPREGCYIIHTCRCKRSGCVLRRVRAAFLPERKSNGAPMKTSQIKETDVRFWFALDSGATRFSRKSHGATHQRFDTAIGVQRLFGVKDKRSPGGARGGKSISLPADKEASLKASL